MTRINDLYQHGQVVWLDFLSREMLNNGRLKALVDSGEVTGVTSNPTIFDKAMGEGMAYDEGIRDRLEWKPDIAPEKLYEELAVEDVQMAADLLRDSYERWHYCTGYVSIEENPHIAYDTRASIEEARRLWSAVDRPNVYVKIPSTAEGLPAVTKCLSEGININITLMFSIRDYEDVAEAFMKAIEMRAEAGGRLEQLTSVASFFVSRIDTAVDEELPEDSPLRGKIAIANTKIAYGRFRQAFGSERWRALAACGARTQRFLAASTSTKNPSYRDTMYVEELIGPETVNTMPLETLEAFRDHGTARPGTIMEGLDEARRRLESLKEMGIDLDEICRKLRVKGVESFAKSYDGVIETMRKKKDQLSPAGSRR